MEEKISAVNVQIAYVTKESGFHVYGEAEVAAMLA